MSATIEIHPCRGMTANKCCEITAVETRGGYSGDGMVIPITLSAFEAREIGERLIRMAEKAERLSQSR